MNDLLTECTTNLFEHFGCSVEVLVASHEGSTDGSPAILAWDAKQSRFLLVDLGDHVDARYSTRRVRADEVLSRAGMSFVRIAVFRTRQELADRFTWLPADTVVWIASEPNHHIDLGGNRLIRSGPTR